MSDKENLETRKSYVHGSIVKIVFHNFLTYDDVVVNAGPYLNLVIGPNGTGKSTIICGICLAVGGEPKLLGRSDQYCEFIKHGHEEGHVQLHLWDSRRKREMVFAMYLKSPNKCIFTIDGHNKKIAEVRDEAKKFNIQVENPCTFLAQDKVKSFAEQGPRKLLHNTEKAGPPELSILHKELEEMSQEGEEYSNNLQRCRKRLERINVDLTTKKARVDNYIEWTKHEQKVTLLKWKKALLHYQNEKTEYGVALTEADEAKARLDEMKAKLKPQAKSIEVIARSCDEIGRSLVQNTRKQANLENRLTEAKDRSGQHELQDASRELERVQKAHQNWDNERSKLENAVQNFKGQYERARQEYRPNPDIDPMRAEIKREGERIEKEFNAINQEQNSLARLRTAQETESNQQRRVFDQKMQKLIQITRNRGIMGAWEFYVRNKERFRGPVFVPYLHMHIPNAEDLIYFNNVVGTRDLGIFVFSCQEDENLLIQGNNPHRIATTVIDQQRIDNFLAERQRHSQQLPDILRENGFTSLMVNMFRAPHAVSAFLCHTYNLDRIPIGGAQVADRYERIGHAIGRQYPLFLTNKSRIEMKFSRYDSSAAYANRSDFSLNNQRFCMENTQRLVNIDDRERELRGSQARLNERKEQWRNDDRAWREQMASFKEVERAEREKVNRVQEYRQKMERCSAALDEYLTDRPDIAAAQAQFVEQKRTIVDIALTNFEHMLDLKEEQRNVFLEFDLLNGDMTRLKERKRVLEAIREAQEGEVRVFEQDYRAKLRQSEEKRGFLEDAKRYFANMATFSPDKVSRSGALNAPNNPKSVALFQNALRGDEKRKYKQMDRDFAEHEIPNSVEECEQMQGELAKKSIHGQQQEGTNKDVEEYQHLMKEKEELGADIRRYETRNGYWQAKMDDKMEQWLDPLRELVTRISANFLGFIQQIGCEGEVQLSEPQEKPEDKYKILEYGIKIFVRFRNGNALKELNPQTQSGGERSVATMLYLMALQDLCPVPFRCLDEINQGMDPENERAVFNMMVELLNTGQNMSKTQYFLLTPKLLKGLDFNERVTAHIVHNGPAIDNEGMWNTQRYVDKLRGRRDADSDDD